MLHQCQRIALILSFLLLSRQAMGASFDCGAATTYVEKLICSDDTLNEADEEMAASYKSALVLDPATKDIQVKWLTEIRNKCRDANCLTDAYLDQLSTLERIVSSHKMIALKSLQQNGSDHKEVADQGNLPLGKSDFQLVTPSSSDDSSPERKTRTLATALLALVVIFTFLVINGIRLGLSDTLIFYENGWDVFLTLLVWILPLILSFGAGFVGYAESKDASSELAQLSRDMNLPFTLGVSAVASWLLMTAIVFVKNIKLNGFGFSAMCVFVAKVTVSFLLFFSWGRWNDSEKPIGARINALIVFGLLAMFTTRLTNGAAVKRGRLVKAGDMAPAF